MLAAPPPAAHVSPAPPAFSAAFLVGYDFNIICLGQLTQATSAQDFVGRVDTAVKAAGKSPPGRYSDYLNGYRSLSLPTIASIPTKDAARVRVEGMGGGTCRITYAGPDVQTLYGQFRDTLIGNMGQECVTNLVESGRVSASCRPGHDPGATTVVERSGTDANARLTVSVTFNAPATHPDYYDSPSDPPRR